MQSSQTKSFLTYEQQIERLKGRGMIVPCELYAKKKLTQVGYYRLSGYWHTLRCYQTNEANENILTEQFLANIKFEDVHQLYIFDKKLRILLLDIIERLEIHIKNIIGHTLSEIDPLCYQNKDFIDPKKAEDYDKWLNKLNASINASKEISIKHHKEKGMEIPCWVLTDIWDFGTLSKYFSLLKGRYKNKIAGHFISDDKAAIIFEKWLREINLLRNLSAHHMRVWNRYFNSEIIIPNNIEYFQKIEFSRENKRKLFPRLYVLWYLISQTSVNYSWGSNLIKLLNNGKPQLPTTELSVMGIPQDIGLEDITPLFDRPK